jgi:hypothetical protein
MRTLAALVLGIMIGLGVVLAFVIASNVGVYQYLVVYDGILAVQASTDVVPYPVNRSEWLTPRKSSECGPAQDRAEQGGPAIGCD